MLEGLVPKAEMQAIARLLVEKGGWRNEPNPNDGCYGMSFDQAEGSYLEWCPAQPGIEKATGL